MTSFINDRGKPPTQGTVTNVAETFTGGIISVAGSPITTSGTLALTVAGTSGGVPYFSSGTAWATSAALAASAIVLGGGAGNPPATTTTGTGVVTALGVAVGSAGAFVTNGGALGTPSSGTLTSATGLPVGTGISGLGTGVATALAVNVSSAGAFVTFNGALGTPSSGTATNLTGTAASLTAGTASAVAVGGITGLGSNVSTFLATPSSANLAAAITDEIGSGKAVFGITPTAWTPTGNGVTLTVNSAGYVTIGGLVIASFDVTWPSTADAGDAQIKDLPVASNATYRGAAIFGYTDYGVGLLGQVPNGGTYAALFTLAGAIITNAGASTKRFIGVAVYLS